jgi:hypothetical protein
MTHKDIVQRAAYQLKQDIECDIEWDKSVGPKEVDGEVYVTINGDRFRFVVEVKKIVNNAQLPQILIRADRYRPNYILVAEKIATKVKSELRSEQLAYIEANGNIYLNQLGTKRVLIYIDGKKPLPDTGEKLNRAFTKTGLKVVFYFLLHEEAINKTQREIAEKAGTALGNVSNVLSGLKADGFLVPESRTTFRLINRTELLQKWVISYQKVLKPKIEIGRFNFAKENQQYNWQEIVLNEQQSWWGGEPGANLLTGYLKPEIFTLYSTESKADLIRNYRLRPDPAGKIWVYKKFWEDEEATKVVVPPLLIYADLINTGDKRCIETAQRIFNEFLQDRFTEA